MLLSMLVIKHPAFKYNFQNKLSDLPETDEIKDFARFSTGNVSGIKK